MPSNDSSVVVCQTHGTFKVTGVLPPAPCPICLFYGKDAPVDPLPGTGVSE